MDDLYGTINRAIESKQNEPSSFAYAAWLMVVQLMKVLKADGKLSDEQLETIIDKSTEIADNNPRASAEAMMGIFYVTCDLLGLPTDQFEFDESDDDETGEATP